MIASRIKSIMACTAVGILGAILLGLVSMAQAQPNIDRHPHYPDRGSYVTTLPHGHNHYAYRGGHYYYHGGVWYRPYGASFVIIAPPFGVVIPVLPPYYDTYWFGGIPYYYANDVYYRSVPNGYEVVEPPSGPVGAEQPVSGEKSFIYPRQNQSEQQQSKDKYECHRWAVGQTGFDPTQPAPGSGPNKQKRSDYQRAMNACLDARGYTVK